MKRQFKIPLVFKNNSQSPLSDEWRCVEYAPSDSYVLQPPFEMGSDFEVEVVQQRRQLDPNPIYRIIERSRYSNKIIAKSPEFRAIHLSVARVGSEVIIECPVQRFQTIYVDKKGIAHAVQTWNFHRTVPRCSNRESDNNFGLGIPDCPQCLAVKTDWIRFIVQPYEHPRAVEKTQHKAKVKKRIRSRYPTSFDRILSDDWFSED